MHSHLAYDCVKKMEAWAHQGLGFAETVESDKPATSKLVFSCAVDRVRNADRIAKAFALNHRGADEVHSHPGWFQAIWAAGEESLVLDVIETEGRLEFLVWADAA